MNIKTVNLFQDETVFENGSGQSHCFALPFDGAQADKAKARSLPDLLPLSRRSQTPGSIVILSWRLQNHRVDCHPEQAVVDCRVEG
ncbi:MAG: hypothetical protein RLN96_08345 [Pseudomonadales bacterium]